MKLKNLFLLALLLIASFSYAANAALESLEADTIRMTLILSPHHASLNIDYAAELEEAYRQVEEGMELSNQKFGGLNQEAMEFVSERDFGPGNSRKPVAKVVKTIVLDTLADAETITSVLLAALDTDSEMYAKNSNLAENIHDANSAFNVWLTHGIEIETATVAGATGGPHIVLVGNGGMPHRICAHEIGHVGVVLDTTINSNGDTSIIATGIGHGLSMNTDQEYVVTLNGVVDTIEIGTPSIMSGGQKGPYFSKLSANGIAIGLKREFLKYPHFEDKRFFVDLMDIDGNLLPDTTTAESLVIHSSLRAFEEDEKIESWDGVNKQVNIYDQSGSLIFEEEFLQNEISSDSITLEEGDNSFNVDLRNICTNEKITKQVNIFRSFPSTVSDDLLEKNVSVFPNPADKNLHVKFPLSYNFSKVQYYILDNTGKQIKTGIIHTSAPQINIEELNGGLYFLNFESASKLKSISFIKV